MSSGWFYMSSGWIRKSHRVGPITDLELLEQIDKGKVLPTTLLKSDRTRGKWVPMSTVGPAMQRWQELHPGEEQQQPQAQ